MKITLIKILIYHFEGGLDFNAHICTKRTHTKGSVQDYHCLCAYNTYLMIPGLLQPSSYAALTGGAYWKVSRFQMVSVEKTALSP